MTERLIDKRLREIMQTVKTITASELENKFNNEEPFLLIDVRGEEEWNKGHLPKAVHCDRGMLEIKIENLSDSLEQQIILYCGGGTRSALSAENLQKMGFKDVISLTGGFRGWHGAGLKIET